MAKTGRNAPCPCGSGKKYKKCCLGSPEAGLALPEPGHIPPEWVAPPLEPDPAGMLLDMPPWVIARTKGEEDPDWPASPTRVAGMSTEEILHRLAELGLSVTRARFLEIADGRELAWTVSDVWRKELGRELDVPDDWFLIIAAIELFKRWLPGTITMEVLDERMQAGYERAMERDHAAAARIWLDLYDEIEPRIPRRVTSTTATFAKEVFWGEQLIGNWLQDLSLAIQNAALRDADLAREGDRFFRRLLARFPDTEPGELDCFRRDHACTLALLDLDEAVRLLEEMLEHGTQPGATYSALAFILTFGSPDRTRLDRAVALLGEAVSRPDVDENDYQLKARLEEARRARDEIDATT